MKAFFRVFRFAVLIWTLMGICGCATSQPTASQADTGTTANGLGEWMNAIGESLYNSVWVEQQAIRGRIEEKESKLIICPMQDRVLPY